MNRRWIMIAALVLVGCDKADNAPGPGGVSMGEARALDEAAEMLDARRPPPELAQPSEVDGAGGQASGQADDQADDQATGER